MKNLFKALKMTQDDLEMALMTFKWHWDREQLHHYVCHEKTFKRAAKLSVLDSLMKNSVF